jgi:hypothetical protein
MPKPPKGWADAESPLHFKIPSTEQDFLRQKAKAGQQIQVIVVPPVLMHPEPINFEDKKPPPSFATMYLMLASIHVFSKDRDFQEFLKSAEAASAGPQLTRAPPLKFLAMWLRKR